MDRIDDGVRTSLEQQVEKTSTTHQPDAASEQGEQAFLAELGGAGRANGFANALRDGAPRPELPGRIEPFTLIALATALAY